MGNTPSVDAPKERTSRPPTERPQNRRPIFAEVLGETVGTIGRHDQGASSLTVTPLPKDADIVVRTPGIAKTYSGQTAAFRSGRQSFVRGEIKETRGLVHRGQVKCTIGGIEPESALAWAIRRYIRETDVDMEPMSENEITLRARMSFSEFSKKIRAVCEIIEDLRSMGVDDDGIVEILPVYRRDRRSYPDETIIRFVTTGHHRLAKHCLAKCCDGSAKTAVENKLIDILRNRLTDRQVDLSALPPPQGPDETRRELVALFCLDLCTRENPDPLQAACLVRDYLNHEEGPLPYQEMVMSCLLGAMRGFDDAPPLIIKLLPGCSQAKQWLKRLEAKQWLAQMAGGPCCDPGTLTISDAIYRAGYIKRILESEHCALAYDLICDLAAALDQRPDLKGNPKLAKLCALRDLDKFNIKLYVKSGWSDSAYLKSQMGKMMLRELLSRGKGETELGHHHEDWFAHLGKCMKGLDGEVILRELLDFPESVRAELFRNPMTRHLLRLTGHPELVSELVKVDIAANDDFGDKLKKLHDAGLEFSGYFGEKPIEIFQHRPPTSETVDLLLDLAEAAVRSTSFVNWATGVLSYLSTQFLLPHQVKRAIALFDPIRSAVRFNPDKLFVATVGDVEMLTGDVAKGKFERNAETVFGDRLEKLKRAGILHPKLPEESETVEIIGVVLEAETVDMLLDLAEAAVLEGRMNWAAGVLAFLSDRVLADDQEYRFMDIRQQTR
jgi:hypothetical protein